VPENETFFAPVKFDRKRVDQFWDSLQRLKMTPRHWRVRHWRVRCCAHALHLVAVWQVFGHCDRFLRWGLRAVRNL
jgi:hypothetical protein